MTAFRRVLFDRRSDAVKNALKNILRGLYYRHEFARRTTKIATESEELLRELSIPRGRGATFLSPTDRRSLTGGIMERFRTLRPPRSAQMADRLRDFLTRRKVLPIESSSERVFPHHEMCDADTA